MCKVPVPLLGMVDYLIGVTEAGFKTTQINAKTVKKYLQFGADKCKFMVVSKKNPEKYFIPALSMDSWELKHEENGDITEKYTGKETMKEEDSLMYLGHGISKKGGNMLNIIHKRNKLIGTEKQILKITKELGPYTFEGALIYIQSLIRTMVLKQCTIRSGVTCN